MRAVRFDEYGPVEVLHVEDVPEPQPEAGEVAVRVRVAGTNPGELGIRSGAMKDMFPATFPSGQGTDLAGVVAAVGDGVTEVAVGDEVIGFSDGRDAQAEVVVLPADHLVAKPADMSWDVAAAIPVVGATAMAMMGAVDPGEGDTVVVAGAAGGVGSIVVQLARRAGCRVIGTASERHHDALRALGAEPVAYGEGLEQRIREAAPDGVDGFFDTHGDGNTDLAIALGVPAEKVDTIIDFPAGERLGVKTVGAYDQDDVRGAIDEVVRLVGEGSIEIPIKGRFPLEAVADAYRELERRSGLGKIVLEVDPA